MRTSSVRPALFGIIAPLALFAQSTASVEGRVTNSVTGEPVSGVKVRFVDRRSYVYSTVTDATGSYRLAGLDDSDYRVDFGKDGFANNANQFFRVAGFVPVRIDTQLKPWATLRGRVVDAEAAPMAGVWVEIDPHASVGGKGTDDKGEFVFTNLPPGSYTLVARLAAKVRLQDGVRVAAIATYYPSATDPALAVRIPVRTGQDVSGLEIKLVSAPVRRVTGVVLNEAGKPAAHAAVKLTSAGTSGMARQVLGGLFGISAGGPANSGPTGALQPLDYAIVGPAAAVETARVESRDDGTFEFPAVAAGDWRLNAEPGVGGDTPRSGVASVSISDQDIDGIQIRLAPSFVPEVTVDWRGDRPSQAAVLTAINLGLTPLDGQPRVAVRPPEVEGLSQRERQDALARFTTAATNRVFPGRYRVLPMAFQPGLHVAAVMWGGRDVNKQVVELTPGTPPFQVILSSESGGVHGTVEKGEGAKVLLVSRDSSDILTYQQTQCRTGGSYEFGNVPPGDYYVVAFDRTDRGGLAVFDLAAQILPIASSVRVDAGSRESVDLRVNKWPW